MQDLILQWTRILFKMFIIASRPVCTIYINTKMQNNQSTLSSSYSGKLQINWNSKIFEIPSDWFNSSRQQEVVCPRISSLLAMRLRYDTAHIYRKRTGNVLFATLLHTPLSLLYCRSVKCTFVGYTYRPTGKDSRSRNIRPINLHTTLLSRVDSLTAFREITLIKCFTYTFPYNLRRNLLNWI